MRLQKVILVALLFLSLALPIHAQEPVSGVNISPSLVEEKADPGGIFSRTLSVTNLGGAVSEFYLISRDIRGLSEDGKPFFAAEGEKTGLELSSWIRLPAEPFSIAPGETKNMPFTIAVPADATPGSHIGAVFVSVGAERPEATGIGIGFQVATIIHLRIAGDVREEAEIREFRTDQSLYSRPNVRFIAKIANTGTVVVRPRGPIEIVNAFGKRVGSIPMNEDAGVVLPQGIRQFEARWQEAGLAIGPYKAMMSLVYGDEEKQTISGGVSFWVVPFGFIGTVFVSVAIVVLLGIMLVKRHIHRQLQRLGHAVPASSPRQEARSMGLLALVALVLLLFVLFAAAFLFLFA